MVEAGELAHRHAQAPAAIQHDQYLLILLILIFTADQTAAAGSGFPVDLTQAVAGVILAELVELHAFATAGLEPAAGKQEGVVGIQLRLADAGKIRVHRHDAMGRAGFA